MKRDRQTEREGSQEATKEVSGGERQTERDKERQNGNRQTQTQRQREQK